MRIVMSHRENVRLLLEKHEELVCDLQKALETVAEPVIRTTPGEVTMMDDDDDANPEMKPLILGVMNEN
jgi:hypothetical protein